MKCKTCKHLVRKDGISLMSQMMGYTGECAMTGILFNLEKTSDAPLWCPIREESKMEEKLKQ